MPYKNADLLFKNPGTPSADDLFVVTEKPVVISASGVTKTTMVRINLDSNAAVLDNRIGFYPGQPTIGQIRKKETKGWLLSGGALITDNKNNIAVGLRDGNAADRFMYTNIGAGRCDQSLQEHCYEERDTEFILCVKERGIWHQVIFGPHTTPLHKLNKPGVNTILSPLLSKLGTVTPPPVANIPIATGLTGNIVVEWYDATGVRITENLSGYVFVDTAVNTTEFRLAIQYDLSGYDEVQIFFGEGTGYAEWQSLDQIRLLAKAGGIARRGFITSFLGHL
ncbi:MAG: hypothetical protein ACXV8O_20030 [Methylobacter sp.]